MKKLVIIGAGSAMFTQGLIVDMMRYLDGKPAELALCDIDPRALTAIEKLAGKMVAAKEANLTVTADTDRKRLLSGADYVVTTIGVGGRRAWEQDVFIPRKYGVYQPVGDTAMPGGISRAMRMIPAMLDILKDIKAICPDAMVFNYANPMAIMMRAITKASDVNVTGLCHGVVNMEHYLADTLGLDRSRFTATAVGINHLTYMYDIRYDGRDLKPAMRELYRQNRSKLNISMVGRGFAESGDDGEAGWLEREPFSWEIFDRYNAFPAPGDRHIVEFYTESFPDGIYYGNRLGLNGGYDFESCIAHGDRIFDRIERLALDSGDLPPDFFDSFAGEHEQLVDIIGSIEGDLRKVFSVNIQNRGAVSNLPYNAVLEMPAAATANGFRALAVHDFPDVLAAQYGRFLSIIELAAESALNGDRNLFAEAVLQGGYISNRNAAEKMVDELIDSHRQYLPQF